MTKPASLNMTDQLQALVDELCKEGSHLSPNFNETLDDTVQKTSELSTGLNLENKATLSALENAAVQLWNKTVLMKTKGCLPNAAIAKLRQASFRMVMFSCSSSKDEMSLKKQILMGMKTAKAWIDCQQFENAENVLELVNQMTQSLHSLVLERTGQPGSDAKCAEDRRYVEEDIFKVTCFKMEVFSGLGKNEDAIQCLQMAKEFLSKFPKESGHLSMLCYNLGVNTYHKKQYDVCTVWLRESYDLGKTQCAVSAKNQARTLRLLANAYLEWNDHGCVEKALNAVSLANTEYPHPAGLYLRLRIMLIAKENTASIRSVVDELLKHPDTVADLCHSVILILQQHSSELEVCPMASSSLERYRNTPEHGCLLTSYLDLLLRFKSHDAKTFAKECIIAHNTDRPMDATTKKRFHILFWEQASKVFQEQKFSDALDWYNYSLSLFRSGSVGVGSTGIAVDGNVAKLHRNRASCYMNLHQLSQAKEALCEAKAADPASVHTSFLCYKLALMESDLETAKSSLEAMVIRQNDPQSAQDMQESNDLISLAAQIAMEQKQESLAVIALSSLVAHLTDPFQALKALRCLIRLSTSLLEAQPLHQCSDQQRQSMTNILTHIRTAYSKLLVLSEHEDKDRAKLDTETAWFTKVAWNLALKNEEEPSIMKEFFKLCNQLLSLQEQNIVTLGHKKVCFLMATAACIQLAHNASDEHDMKCILEEAVHHISEYKSLDTRLMDGSLPNKNKEPAQTLLLLYEFEALTKLGDSCAESVLERALVLPNPEPKLFESFAVLAVEAPANQPRLSMRALKVAIHTHLQAQEPDFTKCSKDIHSLIQQSLACSEEEAFTYFRETADILDKRAQGKYPPMEIVWLMTKAWNTGIRHFCCGSYQEAEKWCGMSMHLLRHIESLRDTYEEQMMSVYTDILDNMEKHRPKQSLED